jgi:hypothetical protein
MSVFTVLPMYAWVTIQIITLFKPDIYIILNSMALNLLTLIQLGLLYACNGNPPVPGCGPAHAFPCTQVTLLAYVVTSTLCYRRDFTMPFNLSYFYSTLAVAILIQWVALATVTIGFATNSSALAGCILGATSACTLHEVVIYLLNKKPLMLHRVIVFIGNITGRTVSNDMLVRFERIATYEHLYNQQTDVDRLETPANIVMGYKDVT